MYVYQRVKLKNPIPRHLNLKEKTKCQNERAKTTSSKISSMAGINIKM